VILLVVGLFAATPSMAGSLVAKVHAPRADGWPVADTPMNGSEDVLLDAGDPCCRFSMPACAPPPHPVFNVGDDVQVDSYWEETVPDSPDWVVEFTAGLKPSGRPVIVFFDHEPVDFGPVPAGTFTFCVSYTLTLPNGAGGKSNIGTGFGVVTDGGTLPPAPYNLFDVN